METTIHYLPQQQFNDLRDRISSVFKSKSTSEEYAFTITLRGESTIVVNSSADLNRDEMTIVLQHEKAHVNGIDDEEMADKWAMKHLSDKQKDILISMWKDRHGHEYK